MSERTAPLLIDRLSKYYGAHRGLEDVSLRAEAGEVLGLLGPNGAGKTTAIRVLLGFLRPTSGRASVMGFDVVSQSVEVRRRVGYLAGDVALYGERTGAELLEFATRVRGLERAARAQEVAAALGATMDRPIKKCSHGMRQKVALVLTMSHDPDVLILDEPTSGLDPLGQRALLELLDAAGQRGKFVLFSSHVLPEAEQICDRVAMLREGRLIALDSIEGLRQHKFRQVTISYEGDAPRLEGLDDLEVIWHQDGRMSFRTKAEASALLARLVSCKVQDLTISEPSLEEVFLDLYRGAAT